MDALYAALLMLLLVILGGMSFILWMVWQCLAVMVEAFGEEPRLQEGGYDDDLQA